MDMPEVKQATESNIVTNKQPTIDPEYTNTGKCPWVNTRGEREGLTCDKPLFSTMLCSAHMKYLPKYIISLKDQPTTIPLSKPSNEPQQERLVYDPPDLSDEEFNFPETPAIPASTFPQNAKDIQLVVLLKIATILENLTTN